MNEIVDTINAELDRLQAEIDALMDRHARMCRARDLLTEPAAAS